MWNEMGSSYETFTAQGWQCPVCKRVYAPYTPWCYFCGQEETKTTTTTSIEISSEPFITGMSHTTSTETATGTDTSSVTLHVKKTVYPKKGKTKYVKNEFYYKNK